MIRPLASRYFCRLTPVSNQTPSGIVIPDGAQEPVYDAEVISAGPG
jgi:co-chaperonin GroES (HSP10)